MAASSRRTFLAVAGAGAAGIGLSSAAGTLVASSGSKISGTPSTEPAAVPANVTGSLVAYVEDFQGDSVSLMVGDDEVVVRDAKLVARLVSAASGLRTSASL